MQSKKQENEMIFEAYRSTLVSENMSDLSTKTISELAGIIRSNWPNVNYAAQPYLKAMLSLSDINDNYYQDDGRSIVAYFLSNASSWKGEVAKAVKTELKNRLSKAYKNT
jgi:hypothetical protein